MSQFTPRSESGSQASAACRGGVGTPRLQSSLRMGAESLLTGSPARAAYKRALTSAINPPQLRLEHMQPAGANGYMTSPKPCQSAQVTELFAMHQLTGAQRLCESSLCGSRWLAGGACTVPRPLPASAVAQVIPKMRISIVGARGLRKIDDLQVGGGGLPETYCTCDIPGKSASKVQTNVINDTLDPEWNFEHDIVDFAVGDSLCFQVWRRDIGKQYGDLLGTVTLHSSQFYPTGFEGELPLAEAGGDIPGYLRVSVHDTCERETELNIYGGFYPEDPITAKIVRTYMLRARRLGARGLPRLAQELRTVAASDGTLDEQGFWQVAMAEGLCRLNNECKRAFGHFRMVGGGVVRVDALISSARGVMRGRRLESVREVWQMLDPEGRGYVEVPDLMAAFDPRRLASVRLTGVNPDVARREYFEGLGACHFTVASKHDEFSLEEAVAGRRPLPIGAPKHDVRLPRHVGAHLGAGAHVGAHGGGGAVGASAGKAGALCEVPRKHGDFIEEVQMRVPRVQQDACISAAQFENFYTALSHGETDERSFERMLRDPWTRRQIHEEAMAARLDISSRKHSSPKAPLCQIAAIFADGSQRVVSLSNIDGLSESVGHAGVHCSQMWTWGPGVKAEIIRRLEAEGVHGVCQVKAIPS